MSEDTSGNLVITHTPSGSELRFTDGGLQFELNAPLKVTDLIDGAGVSHTGELADNDHGTLDGLSDDDHTQYILVDGSRAFGGNINAGSNDLINVTNADTESIANQDYNEPVDTATAVSGTLDFDLSTSNWFERELDGDITIGFSNISSSPPGNSVTIYLEDTDGTGPHTITYPSGTIWPNGNVRDTVDSNGSLEIVMTTPDGGTTWRASRRGADWA
jgi:hypothetical protein